MTRRIKLTIRLRRPAEFFGLAISGGAHLVGLALVVGSGSCGGASIPSTPAVAVTLVGGSTRSARELGGVAAQRSRPAEPEPKPEPKEAQAAVPKPPQPAPTRGRQPAHEPRPPRAADPDQPPSATPSDDPPRTASNGAAVDEANDAPSGPALPAGPIAGGVAGLESIRGVSAGYAGLVAGALQRAWVDRPTLPRGVGVLRVVARFRVQRDGHIEAIELSLPSGYTLLDQSVLRTLRGLDRLPGFPPSIKQGSIDAEFVFELQPTESPN